jgi:hypothetical protein
MLLLLPFCWSSTKSLHCPCPSPPCWQSDDEDKVEQAVLLANSRPNWLHIFFTPYKSDWIGLDGWGGKEIIFFNIYNMEWMGMGRCRPHPNISLALICKFLCLPKSI